MDLAAYRRSAETFVSDLTGEFQRHYAGLSDTYEIEPIYDAHADLFTSGSIERLRRQLDLPGAAEDERRSLRMLLDLAVEGHIGQATKRVEAELARREAALKLDLAGERLGFRESSVAQANEPDRARRAEIEQARLAATTEHLNPLYLELVQRTHEVSLELGYGSHRELCAECKGLDLPRLHSQTSAFVARTDADYGLVMEPELQRTLGFGLAEMRRSDLPRFFRVPEQDRHFPESALTPSFAETMRGLGIDLAAQPNVRLDLESRPKKDPRAFCAPVHVPGEVHLVLAPVGGLDDYSALFHEGGHTEHYAHVDPGLPFEFRHLGDNAITECFAFLFQHLVENPLWLKRRLGVEDAQGVAAHARAERLLYLRRYAAKLAYELELHGPETSWPELAGRYSELLGSALQIPWPQETFLADVDPGFYSACYLRAWALETHLRRHLQDRFGPAWFESPEAGAVLRALWRTGQRSTPDELLAELTGDPLDFGVLVADLGL